MIYSFMKKDPGLERFADEYARIATIPHPFLGERPWVAPEDIEPRKLEGAESIYEKAMGGEHLTREELLSFVAFMYTHDVQSVLAHNELDGNMIHRLRPGDRVFWHLGGECPAIPGIYESEINSVYIDEGSHLVVPCVANYWVDPNGLRAPSLWLASEDSGLVAELETRSPTIVPSENAPRLKRYQQTEFWDVVEVR